MDIRPKCMRSPNIAGNFCQRPTPVENVPNDPTFLRGVVVACSEPLRRSSCAVGRVQSEVSRWSWPETTCWSISRASMKAPVRASTAVAQSLARPS